MVTDEEAVLRNICDEFGIGRYNSHSAIDGGHERNLRLVTTEGVYFLKPLLTPVELALYAIDQRLNQAGIRQPHLYRNLRGDVLSATGYAVFEFLKGETHQELNPAQTISVVGLLADYNTALAQIEPPAFISVCDNPWRKAASVYYVTDMLARDLEKADLPTDIRRVDLDSIAIMTDERHRLESGPSQLVHSDVGPDNVLFDGDRALAIVDFTADFAHELYALCQFLYWQVLWFNELGTAMKEIRTCLKAYMHRRGWDSIDTALFRALLIKAAIFRLLGPLLATLEQEQFYPPEALRKRGKLLRLVIEDSQLRTTDL